MRLTMRRISSVVTFSRMRPMVSIITCLLRRVYSVLIKGLCVFFFFSLVTVVNVLLLTGADPAALA